MTKDLAREIKLKISYLDSLNESKYCFGRRKVIDNFLLENSKINSYRIEYPSFRSNVKLKGFSNQEGYKLLRAAFIWGRDNFDGVSINEDYIKELNFRLSPHSHLKDCPAYRDRNIQISGSLITPPYPAKFREIEMPNLIFEVNSALGKKGRTSFNSLETAMFVHFHLVRIHPFDDGNGRVSRMLQDIILDKARLPIPIILSSERQTYYDCIRQGIKGKREEGKEMSLKSEPSNGERVFYNFVGGKFNVSLDKIIDNCS